MRVVQLENNIVIKVMEIFRPVTDYAEITLIEAGEEVAVGFTYDGLVFTPYAEYQAEQDELTATEYSRLRKAKYDLLNQFEMMTDDASNGTTTHAEAIAAIKLSHPKP
jgi:hypothetical protein